MTGARARRAKRMRGAGRGSRNAGFLLAETLATFALSALVLVALTSSAAVLVRAVDGSTGRVSQVDDLARTMDALRRDIGSLARARWFGEEPQPFVFRGGPNSLYFAHREQAADGAAEMHVVALREVVRGAGTEVERSDARLPLEATGFAALTFGPPRPLPTGAARLRFGYIKAGTAGSSGSRVDNWPGGKTLPGAVLVQAIDPASGRIMVSSRIAIHANADLGCVLETEQTPGIALPPLGSTTAGPIAPGPEAAVAGPQPSGPPIGGAPPPDADFCGRDDKTAAAAGATP